MELKEVQKAILDVLKQNKGYMTTYEVAKAVNVAWETANRHLFMLLEQGLVETKMERKYDTFKRYWRAK